MTETHEQIYNRLMEKVQYREGWALTDACKELEAANNRIVEYQEDFARVLSEDCPSDEKHCGCVPILREKIAELKATIAAYENDLPLLATTEKIAKLEAENATLREAQRWRPVGERMPRENQNVEVINSSQDVYTFLFSVRLADTFIARYTHWRPFTPPQDLVQCPYAGCSGHLVSTGETDDGIGTAYKCNECGKAFYGKDMK